MILENNDEMIWISKEEYSGLLRESRELSYLEEYGVDNWCGYGDAMQAMNDEDCDCNE